MSGQYRIRFIGTVLDVIVKFVNFWMNCINLKSKLDYKSIYSYFWKRNSDYKSAYNRMSLVIEMLDSFSDDGKVNKM